MRSRKIVTSEWAQKWVLSWLSAIPLPDHGWLCTATVIWKVLVRAAARRQTISATCAEFGAPSLQGVLDALRDGLPKRTSTLERQFLAGLPAHIPRRVLRKRQQVAIDWHLIPYYGQPYADDNELVRSAARSGTTRFHTYATACVLQQGQRYTVALTWVRRNESAVVVLQRLRSQMRQIGLKIKTLLDRQFFSAAVTKWLIDQRQPFLMPVS
ncbi:MAG: transposase [Schlesneria sp.]|nr:transposase [Schlesneria sp.]